MLCVPKDWSDFFNIRPGDEVEVIADSALIVFPPAVMDKEQRINALQKTLDLLHAIPEKPYPESKRGRKKESERVRPGQRAEPKQRTKG